MDAAVDAKPWAVSSLAFRQFYSGRVVTTPRYGRQSIKGTKYPSDLKIVSNAAAPDVTVQGTLESLGQAPSGTATEVGFGPRRLGAPRPYHYCVGLPKFAGLSHLGYRE